MTPPVVAIFRPTTVPAMGLPDRLLGACDCGNVPAATAADFCRAALERQQPRLGDQTTPDQRPDSRKFFLDKRKLAIVRLDLGPQAADLGTHLRIAFPQQRGLAGKRVPPCLKNASLSVHGSAHAGIFRRRVYICGKSQHLGTVAFCFQPRRQTSRSDRPAVDQRQHCLGLGLLESHQDLPGFYHRTVPDENFTDDSALEMLDRLATITSPEAIAAVFSGAIAAQMPKMPKNTPTIAAPMKTIRPTGGFVSSISAKTHLPCAAGIYLFFGCGTPRLGV